MTKNNSDMIIPIGLGFAFLVGMFQYGPIDLTRAVYNGLTGDTPVIKREIGNYLVCKDKEDNPILKNSELVKKLSSELEIPIKDGKINFNDVALDDLFDSAEDRNSNFTPNGLWDSFVWQKLDDYKNPECRFKY